MNKLAEHPTMKETPAPGENLRVSPILLGKTIANGAVRELSDGLTEKRDKEETAQTEMANLADTKSKRHGRRKSKTKAGEMILAAERTTSGEAREP